MSVVERALVFECAGERLIGVLAAPESPPAVGVLIVVGGPQYRAGSHRQFVLLARHLATHGIAALRFDHRGIGDSSGSPPAFEAISEDIEAAVAAFRKASPSLERIAIWGLCDAASAALLYCEATRDARIAALALVNPWVRAPATEARTRLRHYYARRLFAADFWRKLLRGRVAVTGAAREIAGSVRASREAPEEPARSGRAFQDRMADGWRAFEGPLLLVLSGRDLTAREFVECAQTRPSWRGLIERPNVTRVDRPRADHTLSADEERRAVDDCTMAWLVESCGARRT